MSDNVCKHGRTPDTCLTCEADQLAWDRFAAAAPLPPPSKDVGWHAADYAEMAAEFADALMLKRAQRLAGKPGEGK